MTFRAGGVTPVGPVPPSEAEGEVTRLDWRDVPGATTALLVEAFRKRTASFARNLVAFDLPRFDLSRDFASKFSRKGPPGDGRDPV